MRESRSEFIMLRGLRYHLRHWGAQEAPLLVMLHGWMDVSASFQFVVDALQRDWHVIAPDWRGFGLSAASASDTYWFADYLGDLDALVQQVSPHAPLALLGHSMGGNVATLYAGIRPAKVSYLINLEGFGLPVTDPAQAPQRYARWLDELASSLPMRDYASRAEVAARLQKTNPRLANAHADFLAGHWAAEQPDGRWRILADEAHRRSAPILYRIEEVLACWRQITAPVLWVEAADTDVWRWLGARETARREIDRRIAVLPQVTTVTIEQAGHMLHHDQPQQLARLIDDFLR